MSLGLKVGFKKTLYFNAGVLTGFCIITLLCAFFCAKLNEWIPEIRLPMLVLGTLYLIWLAVKILRSTYDTKAVEYSSHTLSLHCAGRSNEEEIRILASKLNRII